MSILHFGLWMYEQDSRELGERQGGMVRECENSQTDELLSVWYHLQEALQCRLRPTFTDFI